MYRRKSPCGRHPPKPLKEHVELTEFKEEAMPIHQQIENLRTKLALKERYNNVLKDELEESREGASSTLKDLYNEVLSLRQALIEAIGKEKFAVQKALRTHRLFQLALRSKTPAFAIAWLDDKLFDFAKRLNLLVNQLLDKRRKLHQAERLVFEIEKWPHPGSLPWEIEMEKRIQQINISSSNVGVKLETAKILNIKYQEIKIKLRDEQELYGPIIRNLDIQLKNQIKEFTTLQKMLDDAEFFQADAVTNLEATEHEAYQNRKARRLQMARAKKAVEKVLEENTRTTQAKDGQDTSISTRTHTAIRIISARLMDQQTIYHTELTERLKYKKAEIEKLQMWVSHLVETMRVPNVLHIPIRLKTVMKLSSQLKSERNSREQLRNVLVTQKDQLLLILSHIRYTGSAEEAEFQKVTSDYDENILKMEKEVAVGRANLQRLGDTASAIRISMISIQSQLDDNPERTKTFKSSSQLIRHMPILHDKIRHLTSSIKALKSLFGASEPERDYSVGVKGPTVPERFVRVGTPLLSDPSDDEDYEDYKVPTRGEILAASQKVIVQGKLRRGIN